MSAEAIEAMRRIAEVADAAARQLGYGSAHEMYVHVDPNAPQREFAPYEPEGEMAPMSSGMAEVIAAHQKRSMGMSGDSPDTCKCRVKVYPADGETYIEERRDTAFAAHVAEELAKAGYGKLPEVQGELNIPAVFGRIVEDRDYHLSRDEAWGVWRTVYQLFQSSYPDPKGGMLRHLFGQIERETWEGERCGVCGDYGRPDCWDKC